MIAGEAYSDAQGQHRGGLSVLRAAAPRRSHEWPLAIFQDRSRG
jgi:hypothetical protein